MTGGRAEAGGVARRRRLLASGRDQLVVGTYQLGAAIAGRGPRPVVDATAAAISRIRLARRPAEAAMYLRHLGRVLGAPVTGAEAERWLRRVTASYTRYWVEMLALPAVGGAAVDRRFTVAEGWGPLRAALESRRGVILALPHLGSWEWGGAWLARRGHPMMAVAERLEPEALFQWFVRQRRALGLEIVPLGPEAGAALLRTLRSGGLVGLVADRDLTGSGIEVELFGDRTTLPAGPATLALRTGSALFPTAVYQGPGDSHTGVVLPEVDLRRTGGLRADVARVTQELAAGFEELIRRAPDQWYCFQPIWPGDGAPESAQVSTGERLRVP